MTPRALRRALSPWLTAACMFVLWEVACRVFSVPEMVLPSPSAAVRAMIDFWPAIVEGALQTLYTTIVGFLLALVFGLLLGALVGAVRPSTAQSIH